MPELRLVVLALQDRLAYGPTFEAALASLYGGEVSSLRTAEAPQPGPASTTPQSADLHSLIAEAGKDLSDYQRLTAEGKLGEAGQKLEELKRSVNLELDHVTSGKPLADAPVIRLDDCAGAIVRDSKAFPGTGTFLSVGPGELKEIWLEGNLLGNAKTPKEEAPASR
jgi:hypothetical protein